MALMTSGFGAEAYEAKFLEGVEEATAKVLEFLRVNQANFENEGDIDLALRNHGYGGRESGPISTYLLEQSTDIAALANSIIEDASEDAHGIEFGKGVRYIISTENLSKQKTCTFNLKFPQQKKEDEDEMFEEVANEKGIVHQQMRHNEKIMGMLVQVTRDHNHLMKGMLNEAHARVRAMEQDRIRTVETFEKLMDQSHARDIEMKKIEASERRKEKVADIAMQGIPVIINRALGGKFVKDASTPLEGVVESLINTLTPEQLEKIMASNIFTPDQVMTLIEMVQTIRQKQIARGSLPKDPVQEEMQGEVVSKDEVKKGKG